MIPGLLMFFVKIFVTDELNPEVNSGAEALCHQDV
jgi:hypothetical protein